MFTAKELIEELKKYDQNMPLVLTIPMSNKPVIIKLVDKVEISSITNPTDFTSKEVISIVGK